jgi:hypothetical protein
VDKVSYGNSQYFLSVFLLKLLRNKRQLFKKESAVETSCKDGIDLVFLSLYYLCPNPEFIKLFLCGEEYVVSFK